LLSRFNHAPLGWNEYFFLVFDLVADVMVELLL